MYGKLLKLWEPGHSKVTVSICVSDPFPHPMITPQCTFPLTYSSTIPEGAMNASA
jgi:hypothetical protein